MEKQVKLGERAAYFGGVAGQNMVYSFISAYVVFFFTDLLLIEKGIVTIITVVASLWDTINDPMMGVITDKTRTKLGKFRPYLIYGPVFVVITSILCFMKFDVSANTTILIAALAYILWGMSYTVYDIPIWAVTSTISTVPEERNIIVTLGKLGGTVGSAIVTVVAIMLINAFGGERVASAYTNTALIFVVSGGLLMFIAGLKVRERVPLEKETVSIGKNLKTITSNAPMKALMASLLISNLALVVRQTSQMYFVVYVWQDSSLLTPIGVSLILGMCTGMILTPYLINRMDKRKLFFIFALFGALTSIIPYIIDPQNVMLGLVFLGLSFFSTGGISIICSTMLLDAVEYSEYKLGFRGEGIIFSVNTFLTKLSTTIAKLILFIMLFLLDYVENMASTAEVINGFASLIYVIPAVSFIIAMIPMAFYKLTDSERAKIHAELEKRHAEEVEAK